VGAVLVQGSQLVEKVGDDQIRSIIQASLGSQTEVAECRFMDGGQFNTSYEITTRNPAQHVVLRIAPRLDRSPLRSGRDTLLAQPVIQRLLQQAGVPTAQVLTADGSRALIDRDYMIVDYIDAVPMNHPWVGAGARPQLRREVGRCVARMHGISADRFGRIMPDGAVRGSASWAEVFGEILTDTCGQSFAAGVISGGDVDAALGLYRAQRAVFDECRAPVLVHNDIWDPNILVRQNDGHWRIAALIDADGALFAEREFEFALWDEADADLLSGYGRPLDASASAALRRAFYRLQLYLIYAWFYLVLTPNPAFQASARRTALDTLHALRVDSA